MSYHLAHDAAHDAYRLAVWREVARDLAIEMELDAEPDKAKVKIAAVALAWQPAGGTPYGRAVLARLVERVGSAVEGTRNNTLSRAAYLAGGYVGGGELDTEYVLGALAQAAQIAGLRRDEVLQTLRQGVRKGLAKPLYAPSR